MRYIISVREEARVQYLVEADSPDEARAVLERGEAEKPLLDEHYDGEIVDVKELAS